MRWRFFTIFASIISAPLLLIVFFTFGQEKFHVLDTVCIFILVAIAFTGAMRGFVNYGVKRKPSPLSDVFTSDFGLKKRKSIVVSIAALCLLCLSVAFELYFALTIYSLSSSGRAVEIHPGVPFKIEPGVYTLWINWGEQIASNTSDAAGQFQIKQSDNNQVVLGKVVGSESVYRRNGESLSAVCDYAFLTSHSYVLTEVGNHTSLLILLRPKTPIPTVMVAFCCFFSGILLALVAGCLYFVSSKRVSHH